MTAYRLYRGALGGRVSRSERHRISAAGAVPRAERYGGFSNRSVLLSVEANADAKDGLWRKEVIHLQRCSKRAGVPTRQVQHSTEVLW
jgi:hypothetical protein